RDDDDGGPIVGRHAGDVPVEAAGPVGAAGIEPRPVVGGGLGTRDERSSEQGEKDRTSAYEDPPATKARRCPLRSERGRPHGTCPPRGMSRVQRGAYAPSPPYVIAKKLRNAANLPRRIRPSRTLDGCSSSSGRSCEVSIGRPSS